MSGHDTATETDIRRELFSNVPLKQDNKTTREKKFKKVCIAGSLQRNPVSRLTAAGRHLPHGITQCYLPPDTSERAPMGLNPSQ